MKLIWLWDKSRLDFGTKLPKCSKPGSFCIFNVFLYCLPSPVNVHNKQKISKAIIRGFFTTSNLLFLLVHYNISISLRPSHKFMLTTEYGELVTMQNFAMRARLRCWIIAPFLSHSIIDSLSQTKFSTSVARRRSRQYYKHFGTPSWRANFNFHQLVQPSWITLPLLHIMVIISMFIVHQTPLEFQRLVKVESTQRRMQKIWVIKSHCSKGSAASL